MRRLDREKTRYRRALQAGLAISLIAHVAALGLGVIEIPFSPSNERSASETALSNPFEANAPLEVVLASEDARPARSADSSADSPDRALPAPPRELEPVPMDRPSPPDAVSEVAVLLARAGATAEAPTPPTPSLTAATVETGFTPMQDPQETGVHLAADGEKDGDGDRGSGIRISIIGPGGECSTPAIIDRAFPRVGASRSAASPSFRLRVRRGW